MTRKIYIVGGGSSLVGFDFKRLGNLETIAVNYSVFDVPSPDYFITLDQTFFNKPAVRKRCPIVANEKIFVINYASGSLRDVNNQVIDRAGRVYDFKPFDKVIKSYKYGGFGNSFDDFRNGANSGYCALQLALILGYEEVHLLGIDLCGGPITHYHKAYPNNRMPGLDTFRTHWRNGLRELQKTFPSVRVISHSANSILNDQIEYQPLSLV